MKIIDTENLDRIERYSGVFAKFSNLTNFTFIELGISAGKELEEHINEEDVVFYIISGKGDFLYNGDTFQVKAGTLIEVGAGTMRGWRNESNEELKILVIK